MAVAHFDLLPALARGWGDHGRIAAAGLTRPHGRAPSGQDTMNKMMNLPERRSLDANAELCR